MTTRQKVSVILGLSLIMWGWVGYRVLAVQTAKFGPVSVRITGLDQANKFVQWSPRVEKYQFTSRHELVLPATSTALFLLNPPKRFAHGTVTVDATAHVNLSAEYPPGSVGPANTSATRTWSWSGITRFPGGHRLHIKNLTNRQILVKEIILTFIP